VSFKQKKVNFPSNLFIFAPPPPGISVTHFALPGMPLDAPCQETRTAYSINSAHHIACMLFHSHRKTSNLPVSSLPSFGDGSIEICTSPICIKVNIKNDCNLVISTRYESLY